MEDPITAPRAPGRRRASPLRRAVFALLAVALALAVLELASFVVLWALAGRPLGPGALAVERAAVAGEARAAQDGDTQEWQLRLDDREVLHPYIGYVEAPHGPHLAGFRGLDPEAAQFGFPRNRQRLFFPPSPARLVVAVVGGSVSRQVSFGSQRLLQEGLARLERFRGREVVVLSLGLGGFKQPQQVMVVNWFLALGLHADLLLNVDGLNEVTLSAPENLTTGVNPFYPRAWAFRVGGIDPDERRLRGEVELLRDLRRQTAVAFDRWPWRASLSCGLIWRLADRSVVGRVAAREQQLLDRGPADRRYQVLGPAFEARPPEALAAEMAAVWARSSLQLHQLASGRGLEYYHFLQPNQYDPGSKPLTARERREAYDPASPSVRSAAVGYPALRRASAELRQAGVAFTDLSGLFAATTEDVYVDTCCHMNELGLGMVVDRVVAAVAAGPVPAPVGPAPAPR